MIKNKKQNRIKQIENNNLKIIKRNIKDKSLKKVKAFFIVELCSLTIKYKIDLCGYYSAYCLKNELNTYNPHILINMSKGVII